MVYFEFNFYVLEEIIVCILDLMVLSVVNLLKGIIFIQILFQNIFKKFRYVLFQILSINVKVYEIINVFLNILFKEFKNIFLWYYEL